MATRDIYNPVIVYNDMGHLIINMKHLDDELQKQVRSAILCNPSFKMLTKESGARIYYLLPGRTKHATFTFPSENGSDVVHVHYQMD